MQTPIADREVEDRFVQLSADEGRIYQEVETYISTTYNQASAKEENAVGFVMTIYRRRLSSSSLRQYLEDRLAAMKLGHSPMQQEYGDDAETAMFDVEDEVL